MIHTVKATREGLPGETTSSGYVIESHVPFVALPSAQALGFAVRVTNPLNGRSISALVLDVGPHSDHDDSYVFGTARPLAESGISLVDGKQAVAGNSAGIDLGGKVWDYLEMKDNTEVSWEFLS